MCAMLTVNTAEDIIGHHCDIVAKIYLFKFNHRNTSKRCEICLKLTIKTPERRP